MKINAKIIADSISEEGKRITTLQLCYPRFIHAEFMTHRVFSRNASSSRAIPVAKMIEQVRNNPAMPIHWGKNQPGMQAKEELDLHQKMYVQDEWRRAAYHACDVAESMRQAGAHKQIVNRILEPFQWIHVIVTASEWDNFFELRNDEDAEPNIRELAMQMKAAMDTSEPELLVHGEWHLPYVTSNDKAAIAELELPSAEAEGMLRNISAARCCRVSYLKHDGTPSSIEEGLKLCDRLVGSRPLHASPFEHQAMPDNTYVCDRDFLKKWFNPRMHGNFVGWIQNRKLVEQRAWA